MGKALQIRVSAVTWAPDLMEKLWPQLTALALTVPSGESKLGVMEMVYRLGDGLKFMDWSAERRAALGEGITQAVKQAKELEAALGDWDPRKANTLSDSIEDILDGLEKKYC